MLAELSAVPVTKMATSPNASPLKFPVTYSTRSLVGIVIVKVGAAGFSPNKLLPKKTRDTVP